LTDEKEEEAAAAASSSFSSVNGPPPRVDARSERNSGYQHDDLVILWPHMSPAGNGGGLLDDVADGELEEGEIDPAALLADWSKAPFAMLALLQDFDNKHELNRAENAAAASAAAQAASVATAAPAGPSSRKDNNPPFKLRVFFDTRDVHSLQLKQSFLAPKHRWLMLKLSNLKTLHREYSALQSCDSLLLKNALLHPPTNEAEAKAFYRNGDASSAAQSDGRAVNPASVLAGVARGATVPLMLQQFPTHLRDFNEAQRTAIAQALLRREGFCLVQGPPGTGQHAHCAAVQLSARYIFRASPC